MMGIVFAGDSGSRLYPITEDLYGKYLMNLSERR